MRESDAALVATRDVYVSHPAAPIVINGPVDISAHARVSHFINRQKVNISSSSSSSSSSNGDETFIK